MHARHPAAGRPALPCLALLVVALTAPASPAQTYAAPAPVAAVEVRLPADAELWFQGVRMAETGERRSFTTPPLRPGLAYSYEVFARWHAAGKDVSRGERLIIHAGDVLVVDFSQPVPDEHGPGRMSVREFKAGSAGAGRGPVYSSLLEWSPRQPMPRRPVGAMSVADLDAAAPARDPRPPGFMSIAEFDRPRR